MPNDFSKRIRIVFLWIQLPIAVLVTAHYLLNTSKLYIHGPRQMFFEFWTKTRTGANSTQRPYDVLILGDSTAQTALNPLHFEPMNAVNLSFNKGLGMISYFVLERYLEVHPPPRCLIYMTQLNWKENRSSFFTKVVSFDAFDNQELERMWQIGFAEGVFPANENSRLEYWIKIFRARLWILEFQGEEIRDYLLLPRRYSVEEKTRLTEKMRGYVTRGPRSTRSFADFFYREIYKDYRSHFQPDRSEDIYFHKLMSLAKSKGIRVFAGRGPVAHTDRNFEIESFLSGRDQHLDELLSHHSEVEQLSLPQFMHASLFDDLTHPTETGSRFISANVARQISAKCSSQED